jgi:hypothetical protein
MPKKKPPQPQAPMVWLTPKAEAGTLSDKQLEQVKELEQTSRTVITVQYFHAFGRFQGEARRKGATSATALASHPDPETMLELLKGKLERKPRSPRTKRSQPKPKTKKGESRA